MSESTIYPSEFELDTVIGGKARIICHWDITTTLIDETVIYHYQEAVVIWTLPKTFDDGGTTVTITSRSDIEDYIQVNANEIMDYAQATKLTV